MSGPQQEISLSSDFDAVVRYGEITVELKSGGDVIVKPNGKKAVVYTSGDGNVYIGLVACAGKPLHAALADEPAGSTSAEARRRDGRRHGLWWHLARHQ
jgi:hypothetical protein